jgi:hypothetical protein
MNSNKHITSIPLFKGRQSNYYIIDNCKYDSHFPLAWALTNHSDDDICHGPNECKWCFKYGSMNGVFFGYCSICLYLLNDTRGDHSISFGFSRFNICEKLLWQKYPYLNGVKITEIGDKSDDESDEDIEETEEEQNRKNRKECLMNERYCEYQRELEETKFTGIRII